MSNWDRIEPLKVLEILISIRTTVRITLAAVILLAVLVIRNLN